MKKRIRVPLVALSVLWLMTAAAFAQGPPADVPGNGPPQDVVDMLNERGWRQVTPEVFQRPVENNPSYETMVFGADGLAWLLRVLDSQRQALEARRTDTLNPDLEEVIAGHLALMEETRELMQDERSGKPLRAPTGSLAGLLAVLDGAAADKAAIACDTTIHRACDAWPISTGPKASGNVTFNETCSAFYADPFCNAYAEGWTGTTFTYNGQTNDPPGAYGNASCAATASVSATSSCFSFGEAQITLQDASFGLVAHYIVKQNFVCRPLVVTIEGPTFVWVPAYGIADALFTASVSGGMPPYSYQWRYNGVMVGNGATYTQYYDNSFPSDSEFTYFDTVTLNVVDSQATTGSDGHNVSVTYEGICLDPCNCPLAIRAHSQDKVPVLPCY